MKEKLISSKRDFVAGSHTTRIASTELHQSDKQIVKFASANDPLFDAYKEIIGPFHLTPQVGYELEFGENSFK